MWEQWKPLFNLLGELSTTITSVGVLVAFFAGIIKPFRMQIIGWIKKQTNTDMIEKHLGAIDERIETLSNTIDCLKQDTEQHNKQNDENIDLFRKTHMMLLRSHIRDIYMRNLDRKAFTTREHKDVNDYFEIYQNEYHGNGYIRSMYESMKDWQIVDGK